MAAQTPSGESAVHEPAGESPVTPIRFPYSNWLLALVLALATFAAYQPVWHAGFIWDDDDHLTANPAMTAPHGLRMIWSSLGVSRYYPLTLTSFWFQRRLWGLSPRPYHLVNVALHAVNGVLLYFVLRRLRIRAAWLAAMLWVLHPVNVESAAWITELKNTQSGAFFFLAVMCFLQFDGGGKHESGKPEIRKRRAGDGAAGYPETTGGIPPYKRAGESGWYALSLLCGLAAMLSKPSTVILPLALLLCVWWERGGRGDGNSDRESRAGRGAGPTNGGGCAEDSARYTSRKRGGWRWADIQRIAPYFIWALGVSAWTIIEQRGNVLRAGTTEWKLSLAERLVIAGKAVWFYAAKLLWPARLAFLYPRWAVDAGTLSSWMPLAALIVVGIVLWRWRRQAWARAGLFGFGFFVAALLPVLGFFDVYYFRYSFVADHFQYLASVGLIAVVASGAATLCDCAGRLGKPMRLVAAAVAVLWLGALTWKQGHIYCDAETLWQDTLTKNPRCWMAQTNLGMTLMSLGHVQEAIEHYEQALRLKHDLAEAHYDLGNALLKAGKIPEAIGHYEEAVRIRPVYAEARNNLGNALVKAGRIQDAIREYEHALRLKPDYVEGQNNLGLALAQQGRLEEAIGHYEEAVRLEPDYAEAHYDLGNALLKAGKIPEAIGHYEEAVRIKPGYAEAHNNLGNALLKAGRIQDAVREYEHALRLKPDSAEAHGNLGNALVQAGRVREAVEVWQQALRINPDLAETHYNLGLALEGLGRMPEAIQHYQEALRLKPDFVQARDALTRLRAGQ
jgi:tetratricopeptide (TPR) repeat protein